MKPAWSREEQPDLAVERILDAAEERMRVERGVGPVLTARRLPQR